MVNAGFGSAKFDVLSFSVPPLPTEPWFSSLASLFQFDTLPPVLEIFQKHRVLVFGLLFWITVFLSRLRVLSVLCM